VTTQDQPAESALLRLHLDELGPLAGLLAGLLAPGVAIVLRGDLGAGKSTLARAILRRLFEDENLEVASPTFPILQVYHAPCLTIGHFDFYRLAAPAEVEEIGYLELLEEGAVLIEWPDIAEALLPEDRVEIAIAPVGDGDVDAVDVVDEVREFKVTGTGRLSAPVSRLVEILCFVRDAGFARSSLVALHGDASSRRYFRLRRSSGPALLMDLPAQCDGPRIYNGRSYGEVVHLAEDVRPFVAVDRALRQAGLSAPEIFAADLERGLLLIEDFGDEVFGRMVAGGAEQEPLWRAGVDVLVHLRSAKPAERLPVEGASTHRLHRYDNEALAVETRLLLQWYWPTLKGTECPADVQAEFDAAWLPSFQRLGALPTGWVLRDYHSPNLIWLPERQGLARVGVIDFQDAMIGHPAYDLVSLLQDARLDVAPEVEARLKAHYVTACQKREPDFSSADFDFAYALLGAQRNTKILGIFARLAKRDGKPDYLRHIPRIWRNLERDLAHPSLAAIAGWYAANLPGRDRSWPGTST
jgi:N-acetylmuramate 1-kinase